MPVVLARMGHHQSMTATSKPVRYPIQLLIRDWLFIDGTMDNHVQSAVDGSVPDDVDDRPDEHSGWDADEDLARLPGVARLSLSIRRAGWEQIPGWPHDLEDFKTWPAPDRRQR